MMQHSIFAAGPTEVDPAFAGITRHTLSAGAWVDYLPNWVSGHERLFDALRGKVEWHHQRRQMYERVVDVPRLTGSAVRSRQRAEPMVEEISALLSEHYGRPLTSVSYAYYRDGHDSVAMHGDKIGRLTDDCTVAIVAVGAPRRFLLREVDGKGALTFDLGWGDLLVMGGTCQRTWRHGIPKAALADPRISIMFRQSLVAIAGLR